MTIEIQRPELEALIQERMREGAFESVEDVLLQALKTAPVPSREDGAPCNSCTGADLVAAMQASPDKEISLDPSRYRMPVRDVVF
jgi:hypothetical protein